MHHDNASPHTSDFTMERLKKWKMELLEHPPNSPDLAPCDFSIFPKLKAKLRGRHFKTLQLLKDEARDILMNFPVSVFDDAMHEMVLRWQKCEAVNGHYFEGDGVEIDPLFKKNAGDDSQEDSDSSSSDDDHTPQD